MFESVTQCASCPAFNPLPDESGAISDGSVKRGECRMRPPVAHLLVIPGAPTGRVVGMAQGPAIMAQTVFPVVMSDAWCQFHPKAEVGAGLAKALSTLGD